MRHIGHIAIAMLGVLATGCFTGVESTPPITAREVRRATPPPSPDDNYMSGVLPTPVSGLREGAQWIVNDARVSRVFGAAAYHKHFSPGDTLTLREVRRAVTLDGRPTGEVVLTDSASDTLYYRTTLAYDTFIADTALSIPFAVEAAIIDAARKLLEGKQYYLLTASRFDMADVAYSGRKFVPVTVTAVSYGNDYYPLSLTLRDDKGTDFKLYMSVGKDSVMPRKFSSLLSLSNPRTQYPDINDEVWQHIVDGTVMLGMTTGECRLALGRPNDVVRQPGYSSLVEIWNYTNGRCLIFTDGLLTTIR